ncbi:MAG: HD domain-containing protein, partial [Bacteroidota bacterium]
DAAGHRPFQMLLEEYTESARRHIKRRLGNQKFDLCVGTGGNLEELGILRKRVLKRASDRSISVRELASLSQKIGHMSLDERMSELNLRPDRADVILPAAIVLHMILKEAGIREIRIPGVGLKEGVLWDMVPALVGTRPPGREQIWLSAMRLGEKYQFDREHGARVARTARRLFDQTAALHEIDPEERILLEVGALLHDIGHFVNSLNHELHGEYILRSSPIIGLDERGRDIAAQLVRYHRKLSPDTRDEKFKALSAEERQTVLKLSALLRLADGIEVSHTPRIHSVMLREGQESWELKLHGEGGLLLEKWTLEKRKNLFEDVFGVTLKVME